MPEPTWTRIGTTTVKDTATVELDGGDLKEAGKLDLFVEVWEVKNDSRDDENYIACTPRAGIYPGKAYGQGWDRCTNNETTLTQDWDENESGGYEISDWGPTTPKTSSLDWSMSASYSQGGAQGGVTASYEVPYIARGIESTPNETVAHEYTYPSSVDIWDDEAKGNFVELESMGEGWIEEPDYSEGMLNVTVSHEFETYKWTDSIRPRQIWLYPSVGASVQCSLKNLLK